MKVVIYTKSVRKENIALFNNILKLLEGLKTEFILFEAFSGHIFKHPGGKKEPELFKDHKDLAAKDIDFFVSIGGDGTFLDSVNYVKDLNIPVLGINTGRLGFLSNNPPDTIEQVFGDLLKGNYKVDDRSVISIEAGCLSFNEKYYALNDFTIHKRDNSSLAAITMYLNNDFFNTYWGDGIIVSTPTGSTAYSMSCGGPIVFPASENFIITPVAPHNLNVRPVIVPDDTVISFVIKAREKKFLISMDSRYKIVDQNCTIKISRADFKLKTVRFNHQSFDSILREKLMWGADNRNN